MCSELYRCIALEALWDFWSGCWSPRIRTVMEENGTRARWLAEFRDDIDAALVALEGRE